VDLDSPISHRKGHKVRIAGIDPGLSGAAFFYDTETFYCQSYLLKSKNGKLDCVDLTRWLIVSRVEYVYLEKIFLAGREGGRSALTIGSNYGRITSACDFSQIPYTEVMPRVWQSALGLKAPSRKELKKVAGKYAIDRFTLFPFITGKKNKIHDGLTDAACIALYGETLWKEMERQSTKSTQTCASSLETSAKSSNTSMTKKPKPKKSSRKKKAE
jgi:hypothetical protein